MLQSLALVSLLTSTALAQSYFTNVSPSCLSFIKDLDNNNALKSCSASLANATAAYGATQDNSKTFTADDITSTLNTICKPDFGCTEANLRTQLTSFYKACTSELTSKNAEVTTLYDAVYSYIPFKKSICGKDDSGSFCALKTASVVSSKPSLLTTLQQYLWNKGTAALSKRADEYTTPNMTTFASTGLPFLFMDPSFDYNTLCTSCTRNTMTNYMAWQADTPYGPGLSASQLLKNENDLYNNITKTCGAQFLQQSVQAAGGLGKGSENGSLRTFGLDLITVLAGVVTMIFASSL